MKRSRDGEPQSSTLSTNQENAAKQYLLAFLAQGEDGLNPMPPETEEQAEAYSIPTVSVAQTLKVTDPLSVPNAVSNNTVAVIWAPNFGNELILFNRVDGNVKHVLPTNSWTGASATSTSADPPGEFGVSSDMFTPAQIWPVDGSGNVSECLIARSDILQKFPNLAEQYSQGRLIGAKLEISSGGRSFESLRMAGSITAGMITDRRGQTFVNAQIESLGRKQSCVNIPADDGVTMIVGPNQQTDLEPIDFSAVYGDGKAGSEVLIEVAVQPSKKLATFGQFSNTLTTTRGNQTSTIAPAKAYFVSSTHMVNSTCMLEQLSTSTKVVGNNVPVADLPPASRLLSTIGNPTLQSVTNIRAGAIPLNCRVKLVFDSKLGVNSLAASPVGNVAHVFASVDATGLTTYVTQTEALPIIGQSFFTLQNDFKYSVVSAGPYPPIADSGNVYVSASAYSAWDAACVASYMNANVNDPPATLTAFEYVSQTSAMGGYALDQINDRATCALDIPQQSGNTWVGSFVFLYAHPTSIVETTLRLVVPNLYSKGMISPTYVARINEIAVGQNIDIKMRAMIEAVANASLAQYLTRSSSPVDVVYASKLASFMRTMFSAPQFPDLKYVYSGSEYKAAYKKYRSFTLKDWLSEASMSGNHRIRGKAWSLFGSIGSVFNDAIDGVKSLAEKVVDPIVNLGKKAYNAVPDDVKNFAKETAISVGKQALQRGAQAAMEAAMAEGEMGFENEDGSGGMLGEAEGMLGEAWGEMGEGGNDDDGMMPGKAYAPFYVGDRLMLTSGNPGGATLKRYIVSSQSTRALANITANLRALRLVATPTRLRELLNVRNQAAIPDRLRQTLQTLSTYGDQSATFAQMKGNPNDYIFFITQNGRVLSLGSISQTDFTEQLRSVANFQQVLGRRVVSGGITIQQFVAELDRTLEQPVSSFFTRAELQRKKNGPTAIDPLVLMARGDPQYRQMKGNEQAQRMITQQENRGTSRYAEQVDSSGRRFRVDQGARMIQGAINGGGAARGDRVDL